MEPLVAKFRSTACIAVGSRVLREPPTLASSDLAATGKSAPELRWILTKEELKD